MSNRRRTKMTAADLTKLRADWERAEWLERLAVGDLAKATPIVDGTQAGTDDDDAA